VRAATGQPWEIVFTPEAEKWFMALGQRDAHRAAAALDELEGKGPGLGRPFVDSIKGSRHHNMKELRSIGGNLRALFAFDPHRRAVVLVGGDKTGNWAGWYERNVKRADALYDRHLREGGKEGSPSLARPRTGGQSGDRGR
jgi:hypothetical protein